VQNLKAHSEVTVKVGTERIPVTAGEADSDERERRGSVGSGGSNEAGAASRALEPDRSLAGHEARWQFPSPTPVRGIVGDPP
jgi:hypothetical protein